MWLLHLSGQTAILHVSWIWTADRCRIIAMYLRYTRLSHFSLPSDSHDSSTYQYHPMPSARHKSSLHSIFLSVFQRALRSEVVTSGPSSHKMVIRIRTAPITISSRVAPVTVAASILRFPLLHPGVASANLEFHLFFKIGWHEDWRENQSGVWVGLRERYSCLRNNLFPFPCTLTISF